MGERQSDGEKKAEGRLHQPARNQQQYGEEVPVWQCKMVGEDHDQTVDWKRKKMQFIFS